MKENTFKSFVTVVVSGIASLIPAYAIFAIWSWSMDQLSTVEAHAAILKVILTLCFVFWGTVISVSLGMMIGIAVAACFIWLFDL